MERTYENTDEIMDYLDIVPVLDGSGLLLDVFLDGRKIGGINEQNKEIEVTVKVAQEDNSKLPYDPNWGSSNCTKYPPGNLRSICENTGNDANTNCVRKCLQDKYPGSAGEIPSLRDPWYWRDHPACYGECKWSPWDIINPVPPSR